MEDTDFYQFFTTTTSIFTSPITGLWYSYLEQE
jgi:hypothetical protein